MSVADRLNKLTTDITNAYTSINNKGGTIPANKNTDNLHTAIDSIQSSNIIGATAEGESLSLTNTKAMPYSDYIVEGKSEQEGEPSPSIPSEIHSVADDVNLFDVTSIPEWVGGSTSYSVNNNTLKVAGSWFVGYLLDVDKNTDYYFSNIKTIITSTNQSGRILVMDNSKNNVIKYIDNENEMTFNTGSYSQIYILFYCGGGNYGEVDFKNIKLQKGTTSTPYSPYNQGTVTIKQRGKNCIDTSSTTISNGVTSTQNSDGSITSTGTTTGGYFNITNVTSFKLPAGTYTFSINSTRNYLTVLTMKNANNTDENKYIGVGNKSITFTTTEEKVKFSVWSYSTSGVEINETISYQLEERNNSNFLRAI